MSVPPLRTIPAETLQRLEKELSDAGLTLGPLKPGTRVTRLVEHDGATWELTYLGRPGGAFVSAWRATGPGYQHGTGVLTGNVADLIRTSAEQHATSDAAPRLDEPLYGRAAVRLGARLRASLPH
jgi:hypothetical protein